MAVRRQLIPPRHLLIVFAGTTVMLAGALVWLGSQLLQQDRTLEGQRFRETLERAATAIGTALQLRLANAQSSLQRLAALPAAERATSLARSGRTLGRGAVLVDFTGRTVSAAPARTLLYDPSAATPPMAANTEFARGEWLEFRERDLRAAADAYRALLSSRQSTVRGGALLRLGRVLRKDGRTDAALDAYSQLSELESEAIDGVPAGLVARHARLGILHDDGRRSEARQEAESLGARLAGGYWRLTRGSFEFYYGEVGDWIARDKTGDHARHTAPSAEAVLLSRAVDTLWRDWTSAVSSTSEGSHLLTVDSVPLLVLSSNHSNGRVALILTPPHLRAAWLDSLEPVSLREGVKLTLTDPAGIPILASPAPANAPRLTRVAAETHLPWTLSVAVADELALSGDFAARRRILLSSLVVVVLLVLVGTYAVARAVTRELAVARLQSDFVAAVSHEFRTPLTSLRQVAELLAGGRVSSEERRAQYHNVLRREAERLHRLVENLLDFGRMEAGAREFRFERLNAAAFVRDVVGEFQQNVAPQGYHVELAVEDPGAVSADREALTRALWNLLDNAVKYSPEHTTIDVSVARLNGDVAVSVRDRGVGIPSDEHATIFEQFVRGRGAKSSGIRGTGIGLAMVRHIVQAHGGDVRFSSAVGAGSTFTIMLPPAADS